jgi:hypothetical protein
MRFALALLAFYGPLCALIGFLFYTGHPVAGAWCIVGLLLGGVKMDGDKGAS